MRAGVNRYMVALLLQFIVAEKKLDALQVCGHHSACRLLLSAAWLLCACSAVALACCCLAHFLPCAPAIPVPPVQDGVESGRLVRDMLEMCFSMLPRIQLHDVQVGMQDGAEPGTAVAI